MKVEERDSRNLQTGKLALIATYPVIHWIYASLPLKRKSIHSILCILVISSCLFLLGYRLTYSVISCQRDTLEHLLRRKKNVFHGPFFILYCSFSVFTRISFFTIFPFLPTSYTILFQFTTLRLCSQHSSSLFERFRQWW